MRDVTLCFLKTDTSICLAMKKRGFGKGKWNGVGGKVEQGETVKTAAVRELHEEIGVQVAESDLLTVGTITFYFNGVPEHNQCMHIFFIQSWRGEPTETDEMAPKWYTHADIPYDEMWVDDRHWLPKALAGTKLEGACYLSADGSELERFDLQEL